MARGISLHIGVNSVNPLTYNNWIGQLFACENDARAMQALAEANGFETTCLLTEAATTDAMITHIEQAAAELEAGDMYMLSFSGHGGQVRDFNGDEADRKDETWCLYDRQHLDDERNYLWSKFKEGVRVLLFSDSCHSGTTYRSGGMTKEECLEIYGTETPVFRQMPDEALAAAYKALAGEYKRIQLELAELDYTVKVPVRLFSGCQDDQRSGERKGSGLFTKRLMDVWADGGFEGHYDEFYQQLIQKMPKKQTPNHVVDYVRSESFDAQRPFDIS